MECTTSSAMVKCMYRTETYMDYNFRIPLPTAMFKVDNFHKIESAGDGTKAATDDTSTKAVDAKQKCSLSNIASRQDAILQQLEAMRNEVTSLAAKVGYNFESTAKKTKVVTPPTPDLLWHPFDLVVSSEPQKAPVVAFLFYHMLRSKGYTVSSPSYFHSSLSDKVENKWLRCIDASRPLVQGRKQIILTFIWRKDPFGPSLKISPKSMTGIKGSNNIARYLARQFDPMLYEGCGPEQAAAVDMWLDGAILQISYGSSKEKAAGIRTMNAHLGGSKWLVGDQMTIADLCAWSTIVTDEALLADSLPKNVKRWFEQCRDSSPFNNISKILNL